MAYPYPPHLETFSYVGKYRYFLTFCTHDRRPYFGNSDVVESVRVQIRRAMTEQQFLVLRTAICQITCIC